MMQFSVFNNEQELLKAIIKLHCHSGIELDPMYSKGNFYKKIKKPNYCYDIDESVCGLEDQLDKPNVGDATNLHWFKDETFYSIILDPPFMFGIHGNTKRYYSSRTCGILKNFRKLQKLYKGILKEAYRLLEKKGTLIFKCQDYTDNISTMTHCLVYDWATELGFYAKDLAILHLEKGKIYNPKLRQRHLRKVHSYFWVFKKK